MISAVNTKNGWKTWGPVWTSTGTAPSGWSLRNSDSNIYRRDGNLVRCKINMWTVGGFGVSGGSGIWTMELPVKPRTNNVTKLSLGTWRYWSAGAQYRQLHGNVITTSTTQTDSKVVFAAVQDDSNALRTLGPGSISSSHIDYSTTDIAFLAELFYEAY